MWRSWWDMRTHSFSSYIIITESNQKSQLYSVWFCFDVNYYKRKKEYFQKRMIPVSKIHLGFQHKNKMMIDIDVDRSNLITFSFIR